MAIFEFLDTSDVESFATELAADLARRFPPASEARTDPGAHNQLRAILENLGIRAFRFHQEKKLGVYKKAKLGNVFQWKLKELGYSAEFSERASKEIVTRLAATRVETPPR
jgi:hypothetical protein